MAKSIKITLLFVIVIHANCSFNKKETENKSFLSTNEAQRDSLFVGESLTQLVQNADSLLVDISGDFQFCQEAMPNWVRDTVIADFYASIPRNYNSRLNFKVSSSLLLCSDHWRIFEIRFGIAGSEYKSNIVGCYNNLDSIAHLLKKSFDDVCSRRSLMSVNREKMKLNISICESFSCDGDEFHYFKNTFQITGRNLQSFKAELNNECLYYK